MSVLSVHVCNAFRSTVERFKGPFVSALGWCDGGYRFGDQGPKLQTNEYGYDQPCTANTSGQ